MDPWDITSAQTFDDLSTDSSDLREYTTENTLNSTADKVKFKVLDTDEYFLLSEAMVELHFTVSGAAGAALTEAQRVALPSVWGLFSKARLDLNSKQIGDVNDPSLVHHITQLPSQSTDYNESVGSSAWYYPIGKRDHSGLVAASNTNPTHTFTGDVVPVAFLGNDDGTILGHPAGHANSAVRFVPWADHVTQVQRRHTVFVAGGATGAGNYSASEFALNPSYDENFVKSMQLMTGNKTCKAMLRLADVFPILSQAFGRVSRGTTITLDLTKNIKVNEAFYSNPVFGTAAPAIQFAFTRASLWLRRLVPSLSTQARLASIFSQNPVTVRKFEAFEIFTSEEFAASAQTGRFPVTATSSKPTRCYIAFQHVNKRIDLNRNPLQFDALPLAELELKIKGESYPSERYVFDNNSTGKDRVLQELYEIHAKVGAYDNGSLVNRENWVNGPHAVYCIDLSHLPESAFVAKNQMDLQILWRLTANANSAYVCHAVLVLEREVQLKLLDAKTEVTRV